MVDPEKVSIEEQARRDSLHPTRKAKLAQQVSKLNDATQETGLLDLSRHYTELDSMGIEGAPEIAKLTLVARSQEWLLGSVMKSLQVLSKLPQEHWDMTFLVAAPYKKTGKLGDATPYFDWRSAPGKRYENFLHFYKTELEETFGDWSELQKLWQRVVNGELTENEATRKILTKAPNAERAAKLAAEPDVVALRNEEGGRPPKNENYANSIVKTVGSTHADYLVRRLKRDAPEIAERLAKGEFKSARAAAIEAGIVKIETPLERVLKLLPKLDKQGRTQVRKWLDDYRP